MKLAIIIGHSKTDKGAANGKINEYDYNSEIADLVKELAPFEVVKVYRLGTYSELPDAVNLTKADLAISLHCNAFNKTAFGCEVLSSGSKNSMLLAQITLKKVFKVFKNDNRGVKIRTLKERGGLILHKTSMPCILIEPVFIDNDNDLKIGLKKKRDYACAIIESVLQYQLI